MVFEPVWNRLVWLNLLQSLILFELLAELGRNLSVCFDLEFYDRSIWGDLVDEGLKNLGVKLNFEFYVDDSEAFVVEEVLEVRTDVRVIEIIEN